MGRARLIDAMPEDAYHRRHELSSSKAKDYLRNPALYYLRHVSQELPGERTKALDFGKAFHLVASQPELAEELIVTSPFDSFRTKEAKAWKAEQLEAGRLILDGKDQARLDRMVGNLHTHPVWAGLFEGAKVEQTILFEFMGHECRARLDLMADGVILDLKSCLAPDPRAFQQAVRKFRYDVQAYWYKRAYEALGLPPPAFLFVAVGKSAPHSVAFYELSLDYMLKAERDVLRALEGIAAGNWRADWESGVNTLEPASWEMAEAYDDDPITLGGEAVPL